MILGIKYKDKSIKYTHFWLFSYIKEDANRLNNYKNNLNLTKSYSKQVPLSQHHKYQEQINESIWPKIITFIPLNRFALGLINARRGPTLVEQRAWTKSKPHSAQRMHLATSQPKIGFPSKKHAESTLDVLFGQTSRGKQPRTSSRPNLGIVSRLTLTHKVSHAERFWSVSWAQEPKWNGQFWRYFEGSKFYLKLGALWLRQQLKFGQIDPELK